MPPGEQTCNYKRWNIMPWVWSMHNPQTTASRCRSALIIKNTNISTHSTSTTTSVYKTRSTVGSRPLQRGSNTALGNGVAHSYQESIHGYGSVFAVMTNWWRRCRTRPRDSGPAMHCQVGYWPADQGGMSPPAPRHHAGASSGSAHGTGGSRCRW